MDWENIRHFTALIEHRSLARAADALGVERTTVSRRIRALEDETGVVLFDRRGRRLELTAAGHDFALATREMSAAADRAARLAAGLRPGMHGRVTISAPPALAAARFVAPLVALGKLHPELEIQLLAEAHTASLSRGDADIAVRLSRPETGDIAISKLAEMPFRLYARADYLRDTPEDARLYVGQGEVPQALPQQVVLNRIARGRMAFRSDDVELQRAAALAGAGIAILPDFAVEAYPDLVPVDAGAPLITREVWSATHSEQRHLERIRAVIETLRSALRTGGAARYGQDFSSA